MKKLLLATTALFVVGGVSAAAADIAISGNVRFHYDTTSDSDTNDAAEGENDNKMSSSTDIWVVGSHTSDSGLSYSGNVRLHQNDGDRVFVSLSDDWGKITLGQDWSPMYSMALSANWRDTIAGTLPDKASRDKVITSTYMTTSGKSDKIAYKTPNMSGFVAGF